MANALARRGSDVDNLAALSRQGDVESLAMELAKLAGTSMKKQLAATGLTPGAYHQLMTNRTFRKRLTELITYLEVTPMTEVTIARRMVNVATDEETPFGTFREASDWLLQQGGMKRGERTEIEVGGRIEISFVVDAPEIDGGYIAPNPLEGVAKRTSDRGRRDDDAVDAEFAVVGGAADDS